MRKFTLNLYKKSLLYILILILYVLTLGLALKIIDKKVSLKYEVDEVFIIAASKKYIADNQEKLKISMLDKKGREIRFQINCLIIASIITFSFATGLVIKRNKIFKN